MKKIIFILIVSFSLLLIAQDNTNKIAEELDNSSELYIKQEIDKEINSLQKDILSNREQSLENKNDINNLFFTKIGAQGLLIGLISGLFSFFGIGYFFKIYLKKKINKDIVALEEECNDSIKKVKKIEKETLLRIQNNEIKNTDLRQKSRILIISETATPVNETLVKIFEKSTSSVVFNYKQIRIKALSFEQVKTAVLNLEGESLHITDFKMIILDNCDAENRRWLDNQNNKDEFRKEMLNFANEFLKLKIGFLYFSNDQYFPSREQGFRNLKNRYLLDYVNSHAHVYENTMNVLKLKNIYSSEEEADEASI